MIRLPTTTSTNELLAAMAAEGAAHGTVVLADHQSEGRGRLGRRWESPPGANVMLSVLLRPRMRIERVPLVCLAAAVAVAEACGGGCAIKWPNDVLAPDGRKLAGILAEAEGDGSGWARHVIVGIGVNANAAPELPTATRLSAVLGRPVDRDALAEAVVSGVMRWVGALECGTVGVLARWRELSCTLGHRVRVGGVEGVAVDLDLDGALRVRDDEGTERRVVAGDVEMVALRHG